MRATEIERYLAIADISFVDGDAVNEYVTSIRNCAETIGHARPQVYHQLDFIVRSCTSIGLTRRASPNGDCKRAKADEHVDAPQSVADLLGVASTDS